jgi:hypothetical protein
MERVRWMDGSDGKRNALAPVLSLLRTHAGVGVRAAWSCDEAARAAARVLAARDDLVEDFGGEQLCLGRAFYTHLESGRASTYFREAAASDARVERVLPGMQQTTLGLLATLLGGSVRRRHGFCGPGVHVFPAGEKVAREGGVVHADLEGLTTSDVARGARAVSFVWMLAPPATRGWLTLFARRTSRRDWPIERAPACPSTTTRSRAGDALLFDSRRLHRIEGFGGTQPRVSITCHAVEVDRDAWVAWF